jgi:hypothetical protein
MIRQCFLANTGIQFHRESFKEIGLDVNTLYPIVLDRPPALKASAADAAEASVSHTADPTDGTLIDEVQASPIAASTFKSEEDEELSDALSPIYDELKVSRGWWILEILPMRFSQQNREDASWKSYLGYVITTSTCRSVPSLTRVRTSPQSEPGSRAHGSRTGPREGRASPGASLRKDQDGGRGSEGRQVCAQGEVYSPRFRLGGLIYGLHKCF